MFILLGAGVHVKGLPVIVAMVHSFDEPEIWLIAKKRGKMF